MCSRIGTITGENKHSFGKTIERSTGAPARCERNQRKHGKRQCVCAVKKELHALITK
jgi:hypothetical protein